MNKYNNKPTIYEGAKYDSKAEVVEAQELEIRRKARDIRHWEAQFPIEFRVRGTLICTYYVDFMIEYPDGRRELKEIKGKETDVFKLKHKMLFAFYGIGEGKIRYKRHEYTYILERVNSRWQDRYDRYRHK